MAPTLTLEDAMDDVGDEVSYSRICLGKVPYFASHLAIFVGLEAEHKVLEEKARALRVARYEAEIMAGLVDSKLNAVCAGVVARLDEMNSDKERGVLRTRLLGNKIPSVFQRPILGGQLSTMRNWPSILSESAFDSLKSYAADVQAAVNEGDAAEADLNAKELAEDNFYTLGEYKKYLDQVNSARKALQGDAEAYRHAHPELNLPRDFVEGLFRKRERERSMTLVQLDRRIASAESLLARLTARRKDLLDEIEATEKERKDAERQAKLAKLAEAQKQAEAAAAVFSALKAELETGG